MANYSNKIVNRFLSEKAYNSLRLGFFAIYKRPNLSGAQELEVLKDAIVRDIDPDQAVVEQKYLLRAGHGGNLDGMATGVLGVALCDGCKILQYLLASNKRYTVTGRLGSSTDTYNNEGKIVSTSKFDHVTRPMLEDALTEFVGEIYQKPPSYSALKINGRRASDIARTGKEVNLLPRPVVCHMARCISFNPPYFTMEVSCGHGFYVRSLVHDLAEAVGTCAHLTALVRTKHGPFTLKDCLHSENYSLSNVTKAVRDAQKSHPELVSKLNDYLENREIKEAELRDKRTQSRSAYRKSVKHKMDVEILDYHTLKRQGYT